MINKEFWKGKKVFITGHTGFKGTWLCLWLQSLGAEVTGYSLPPPTNPSLFNLCNLKQDMTSLNGDIRDYNQLSSFLLDSSPDIVIHMAAQPIVRSSYQNPIETYEINVMGTIHVLESVRQAVENGKSIKAVVNVTSDKCYENKEWPWGYRENEDLGGFDPYSNSKACSELVTSSYRNSFFHPAAYQDHGTAIATVRAGNVIGGGDWSPDRLIPDCMRALLNGEEVKIRKPMAIRPWQHVLEPLSGYLLLTQNLVLNGVSFGEGWNFGPREENAQSVEWIVNYICNKWGSNASYRIVNADPLHEANYLKLDISKAKTLLGWLPKWDLEKALNKTIEWIRAYRDHQDVKSLCLQQISEYQQEEQAGN